MSLKSVRTLTAAQIAKKWDLSLDEVKRLIAQGAVVEKEHTKSDKEAREVARDHLAERPDYYKKLAKMEKTKIVKEMNMNVVRSWPSYDKSNIEDIRSTTGKDLQSRAIRAVSDVANKVSDVAFKTGLASAPKADMNLGKSAEPLNSMPGSKAALAKDGGSTGISNTEFNPTTRYAGANDKYTPTPGSGTTTPTTPSRAGMVNGAIPMSKTPSEKPPASTDSPEAVRDYIGRRTGQMEEGMSTEPERDSEHIGDYTGSARFLAKVAEKRLKEENDIDTQRALAAFRKQETGSYEGNYAAKGRPGRTASGAYQYIDKTWRSVTKALGIGSQYAHASDAPKDVQDAVKTGELKKAGSLDKAVNIHYTGNPAGKMTQKQLSANRGQNSGTYLSNFKKNMAGYNPPGTSDTPKPAEAPKAAEPSSPAPTASKNFSVSVAPKDVEDKMKASSATTPSQPASSTTPSNSYSVQKGDTMSSIAKKYHTDVDTLSKSNSISDPNKISVGQSINLSGQSTTPKAKINEISAELVGKVSNERWRRGQPQSKTLTRAITKKFIESGKKKEVKTTTVKEETTMDTKEIINEALDNILENNLVDMKENLLAALQEKAMERLEEKKKEIAANYFAQ